MYTSLQCHERHIKGAASAQLAEGAGIVKVTIGLWTGLWTLVKIIEIIITES